MSYQSKVSEDYDQYLVMLQERNKLLKKLRRKDSQQIQLEKREQGFALYLNGANLPRTKAPPTRKGQPFELPKTRQRTSKTAGETAVERSEVTVEVINDDRAKTAPSKRKSWQCDSINVKAEEGDHVHVRPPEILSGQYDDDFEPDPGNEGQSQNDELALSFQDIRVLRRSLEKDAVIFTNLRDSLDIQDDKDECSSCSEELESSDDLSPPSSPPPGTIETGIVLEFESQPHSSVNLASRPSTVRMTNPKHNPHPLISSQQSNSTEGCSNSEAPHTVQTESTEGCSNRETPHTVQTDSTEECSNREPSHTVQTDSTEECSNREPSHTVQTDSTEECSNREPSLTHEEEHVTELYSNQSSMATRSLSATRRKQSQQLDDSTQDVIDAVNTENESLDQTSSQPKATVREPFTGSFDVHTAIEHNDNTNTPDQTTPHHDIDIAQAEDPSKEPNTPGNIGIKKRNSLQDKSVASLPFKPVLVSRYKCKPNQQVIESSHLDNHSSSRPVESSHVTSHSSTQTVDSLTERTLSVITDKVRNMDARKQRRLLQLLNKLDAPNISLPTPFTPLPTPTHSLTHKPIEHTLNKQSSSTDTRTSQHLDGTHSHTDHISRPSSTRVTGLRGQLISQQSNDRGSSSRPGSGRVSALRGQLTSGRGHQFNPLESTSDSFLSAIDNDNPIQSSSSNPCLLSGALNEDDPANQTIVDDTEDHPINQVTNDPPRLKTAVLAKGHRPLRLGDSETCPLPNISSHGNSETTPSIAPPISSLVEPDVRSSDMTFDPWIRESKNECLASISQFDHTHLGQIGSYLQDDILESFLSEYREKREERSKPRPLPTPSEEIDDHFVTPELPSGSELVLKILSTWGDRFYVGLTGIEVYTENGDLAEIEQISACPSDINVLPEYNNDPRVVTNLLDGVNQTRDDLHMWLAPYSPGQNHSITLTFTRPTTLALIRIWNYNKSRVHSVRGARMVEMVLDDEVIFHGEIARGDCCETILFTTDEDILYLVSQHDNLYQSQSLDQLNIDTDPYMPPTGGAIDTDHRPFTSACVSQDRHEELQPSEPFSYEHQPFHISPPRSPLPPTGQFSSSSQGSSHSPEGIQQDLHVSPPFDLHTGPDGGLSTGSVLQICLSENWGDVSSIGLTGVEVQTTEGRVLRPDDIHCDFQGHGSEFEVHRLVDGVNLTTDPEHMWAVAFDPSQPHTPTTLTLSLGTPTHVTGLRVWNYNASVEESYRGVKVIHVYLDGVLLSPEAGCLLRRAPGNVEFEFGQLVSFTTPSALPQPGKESELLPRGFVFQLQLLSSWGDPYYIGLNELEMYDSSGHVITLTTDNIAAYPDSVNILPGVQGDLRTPERLIDGVCDKDDGQHMWLAPILPGVVNSVYVVFDEPWTVSEIRLWNYGKPSSRGVKEIAVLVDGLLVYSGTLPAVPSHARGILPTLNPPLDPFLISLRDCWVGGATRTSENDIQLTNNRQVLAHSNKPQKLVANQDLRPMTSLTNYTKKNQHRRW